MDAEVGCTGNAVGHSPPALTRCLVMEQPRGWATQHPGQAARRVPSLPLCRDAAACHPHRGFVSLSPLQTPMGNREPIFELCKVFFCRQGTRTSLLKGPPAVPAGTCSKALERSLASDSNSPFSAGVCKAEQGGSPLRKPKAGVALPSQRDKGLFCPGTILPLTSDAPQPAEPGDRSSEPPFSFATGDLSFQV